MRAEEAVCGAGVAATGLVEGGGMIDDLWTGCCADGVRVTGVFTAGELSADCHRGSVPKLYDGVDR